MVGASVGLAFGDTGEAAEALLHRADTAMYAAKRAGKGRLVIECAERESVDATPADSAQRVMMVESAAATCDRRGAHEPIHPSRPRSRPPSAPW